MEKISAGGAFFSMEKFRCPFSRHRLRCVTLTVTLQTDRRRLNTSGYKFSDNHGCIFICIGYVSYTGIGPMVLLSREVAVWFGADPKVVPYPDLDTYRDSHVITRTVQRSCLITDAIVNMQPGLSVN